MSGLVITIAEEEVLLAAANGAACCDSETHCCFNFSKCVSVLFELFASGSRVASDQMILVVEI